MGLSQQKVTRTEQRLPKRQLMELIVSWPASPIDHLSEPDAVFVTESRIIREIAQRESCVIVGRCADYVLRDNPNLIRVFIHLSEEKEIKAAMLDRSLSQAEAAWYVREKNYERATHYRYYAHGMWGNSDAYDLIINTTHISIEQAVSLILQLSKSKT